MIGQMPARRVLVVSDARLVAETVAAALVQRGFDVVGIDSPHAQESTVGLLLAGLDTAASIAFARVALDEYAVLWVGVIHNELESSRSAAAELGIAEVLRSDASIDAIETALTALLRRT